MTQIFPKKFYYHIGGPILICFFFSFVLGLSIAFLIALSIKGIDSIGWALIPILLALFFLCRIIIRMIKPSVTKIIFQEREIISKTINYQETLDIDKLKGIWYMKDGETHEKAVPYKPDIKLKTNTIVIIGSLAGMDYAEYIKMRGLHYELISNFDYDYTCIKYRKNKGLDEILNYYYSKIEQNKYG